MVIRQNRDKGISRLFRKINLSSAKAAHAIDILEAIDVGYRRISLLHRKVTTLEKTDKSAKGACLFVVRAVYNLELLDTDIFKPHGTNRTDNSTKVSVCFVDITRNRCHGFDQCFGIIRNGKGLDIRPCHIQIGN